jgi:glycosyltransferase involved in cell wall biosynthesis
VSSAGGHGNLRVVQCCVGKFHHFDLARQLHERGLLAAIFTGYPQWKLRGEGLPRQKVRTFPWLQTIYMGKGRLGLTHAWFDRELAWWSREAIDWYCARTLPECDILVGISGCGLRAGREIQRRGGRHVCDRGSAHIRAQDRLLREEFERWREPYSGIDPRSVEKELSEYAQADAITVPSEFARKSFLAEGLPAEKVHLIPYGVDLSRFSKCGDPARASFDVLFVGGVSIRKGVPHLLEAFERFRHPAKSLTIVGAVQPEMRRFVNSCRARQVVFMGALPQRELPALMSRSHVLALPSVEDGFGLVMAQAMACGCPVIASENTGGRDLFQDGVEGFVVPIRDPAALASRLQQMADTPSLRDAMAAEALRRVQRVGGWRAYGDAWDGLCRVLSEPNGSMKEGPTARRTSAIGEQG